MSQTLENEAIAPSQLYNEFAYKPVPPLAPASLALGICSFLGLFFLLGLGLGLVGSVLGIYALVKIQKSKGELGGIIIAGLGTGLSILFFASGLSFYSYTYATEVPEGHQRLNFLQDISKKEFVFNSGQWKLDPEVQSLDGKNVFIKGYMYPVRQTEGLTSFILVKDSDKCCFGGQPKVNDMILVEMQDGLAVDYKTGRVNVAGTFRTKSPNEGGELRPVYEMEGTHFSRSKTIF